MSTNPKRLEVMLASGVLLVTASCTAGSRPSRTGADAREASRHAESAGGQQPSVSTAFSLGPEGTEHFDECYRASLPAHPDLSVRTVVNYVARDGKVVFAYTEIPQAPELEQCIAQKMVGWEGPPGPLALGGGLVQLGPQPSTPPPAPNAADLRARSQRALDAAVSAGVVTADEVAPVSKGQ
jgi:hypothetical protein